MLVLVTVVEKVCQAQVGEEGLAGLGVRFEEVRGECGCGVRHESREQWLVV
jgi:hypothetical protein